MNTRHYYQWGGKVLLYGVLFFFIYLMVLITIQYIPIDYEAAFLALKQDEIQLTHYRVAFFTHVYSSIFVLLLGVFQFSGIIRRHYSLIHKAFGKAYVALILLFAAPSGLIMGYYGNGGFYAQAAFCLLSALWFLFTLKAFLAIRARRIQVHQNFMILSYALTLSAISLRLFKWLIANTLALPPMDTYKIVVWLGWIFNLAVALLLIKAKQRV